MKCFLDKIIVMIFCGAAVLRIGSCLKYVFDPLIDCDPEIRFFDVQKTVSEEDSSAECIKDAFVFSKF